jgi:mRNA-degrading endonuclease RelE of RelBE toxin-antitoxin system
MEISPPAWKQLARLPLELYRRIRGDLEAIAATPGLLKDGGRTAPLSAVIDDYVAFYQVDPERKRLTLLDVARRAQ